MRKGSFTIEAAMIMGMVLFVILSVLSGTQKIYNRTLQIAHAYEEAVTGREKEPAGLWYWESAHEENDSERAEEIAVEWEEIEPVSFLWKTQYIREYMDGKKEE